MSIEKLWNKYNLYFYHEFINSIDFSKSKLELLKQDRGHYYIHNDFTIYQEKYLENESINEKDFLRNYGTFIVILYNLPPNKVKDFIKFHYEKYNNNKSEFLEFVYFELKSSKSTQGGKEIPSPQQKQIAMDWCKNKLDELSSDKKQNDKTNNRTYRKIKAKFIALKNRVISLERIHNSIPSKIFDSISNQFLNEVKKLKYSELEDFIPSNYSQFKKDNNTYYSWASKSLVTDIEYFINFLENIEPEDINIDVSEEGIFFSGQYFDAFLKFNEIISKANSEIILIDNYLDEKILEVLASKNINVKCKVLTLKRTLSSNLKTHIEIFNKQYKNLEVRITSAFHDRFIIIDNSDFYHFGASIKDAGNKGFMFSKIDENLIKKELLKEIKNEWNK